MWLSTTRIQCKNPETATQEFQIPRLSSGICWLPPLIGITEALLIEKAHLMTPHNQHASLICAPGKTQKEEAFWKWEIPRPLKIIISYQSHIFLSVQYVVPQGKAAGQMVCFRTAPNKSPRHGNIIYSVTLHVASLIFNWAVYEVDNLRVTLVPRQRLGIWASQS